MNGITQTLILLAQIATACFSPLNHNPMENPNLYHGDMLFEDYEERNAVPIDKKLWPDGIIQFRISKKLADLTPYILQGMADIMNKTCIKFVPWDGKSKDYIGIFPGDGCYSMWGKVGGAQPVSLGDGCEYYGTILHELMHAIGFDHEQNRSDRDKYLIVYWQNIWPSAVDQFNTHKLEENLLIGDFDYDSIMLYGMKAFSKDGWSKTMKPRKKRVRMLDVIQKNKLSKNDVKKINILYKCDQKQ